MTLRPALAAHTSSPEATRDIAAAVAALCEPGDILVLAGELGSGKTVWVQGFARGLGVDEQVTSPTFTLVRPYKGNRLQLLHADVYRLEALSEVVDLALTEQLDERSVACIEWGDLAEPALPADFLEVRLEYRDEDAVGDGPRAAAPGPAADDTTPDPRRTITFRPVGVRWASRLDRLRDAVSPWLPAQ